MPPKKRGTEPACGDSAPRGGKRFKATLRKELRAFWNTQCTRVANDYVCKGKKPPHKQGGFPR
jgi:hypothetical protein